MSNDKQPPERVWLNPIRSSNGNYVTGATDDLGVVEYVRADLAVRAVPATIWRSPEDSLFERRDSVIMIHGDPKTISMGYPTQIQHLSLPSAWCYQKDLIAAALASHPPPAQWQPIEQALERLRERYWDAHTIKILMLSEGYRLILEPELVTPKDRIKLFEAATLSEALDRALAPPTDREAKNLNR